LWEDGEYFAPLKLQSYKHVNGYKSAIFDFFDKQGLKVNADMKETWIDFIHGYKRKVESLKQDGEMKATEGKSPLSFEGYIFLDKKENWYCVGNFCVGVLVILLEPYG